MPEATSITSYRLSEAGSVKPFLRGRRTISPKETLERVAPLFGPFGITRVANVTGLDTVGIPVFMVCRPNARSLAVSQGKGTDEDAARVSGVMESIELYHAERISLPLYLATHDEQRHREATVNVNTLPRIQGSRLRRETSLLWIRGTDLATGAQVSLPYELVHTNYTLPLPSGSGCFVMSSNGLASGNHFLEAVCHGLCEVIERDAATLFRFQSVEEQDRHRVDLDEVRDPECREVLERFADAGIAVGVWDITSDVRVPSFWCVTLEHASSSFRPLGPIEGMGCHLVREVALLRALTEAAQGRLTLIAGSRDDNGRQRYERSRDVELIKRARERLSLPPSRVWSGVQSTENATLEQDLTSLLGALEDAGCRQALAVDLTKPELGIPVVRVVVPGLEPYHAVPGYSPGARALTRLQELAGARQ